MIFARSARLRLHVRAGLRPGVSAKSIFAGATRTHGGPRRAAPSDRNLFLALCEAHVVGESKRWLVGSIAATRMTGDVAIVKILVVRECGFRRIANQTKGPRFSIRKASRPRQVFKLSSLLNRKGQSRPYRSRTSSMWREHRLPNRWRQAPRGRQSPILERPG
jgi:hypothetical protein